MDKDKLMNENEENEEIKRQLEEEEFEGDDLQAYIKEMEALKSDFSDLDELDMEELQEIQEAIIKVKEGENLVTKELIKDDGNDNAIREELKEEYDLKEAMLTDFSDMDEIDLDELREIQDAIETVKHEVQGTSEDVEGIQPTHEVSKELEERIKEELLKRKELEEEEAVSPDKFLEYISNKRDKIWYHALHYLVFGIEDHTASKSLLFDVLKEVVSKSSIDSIPENQFYFGLGYILRLTLNNKQVVRFMKGRKFKINVSIDLLKEILEKAGDPISTRPVLKEKEKKKMYNDFLKDDFLDI
ncbi:hypothetical protein LCGC14_1117030 [marine sediment metagenome]|uniref:Uncharacterized protein n=1 Tax=marine sediment metagenome TaxID=412755 RepID=A0A0F9PN62_9ZZZZ